MESQARRPSTPAGSCSGISDSTVWCSTLSAATSSFATFSSPARTRTRGSPLTIVSESARLFWLNVSRPASTTARNVWKPGLGRLDEEGDAVAASAELDRLHRDLAAVGVEPDRGRLGDARA